MGTARHRFLLVTLGIAVLLVVVDGLALGEGLALGGKVSAPAMSVNWNKAKAPSWLLLAEKTSVATTHVAFGAGDAWYSGHFSQVFAWKGFQGPKELADPIYARYGLALSTTGGLLLGDEEAYDPVSGQVVPLPPGATTAIEGAGDDGYVRIFSATTPDLAYTVVSKKFQPPKSIKLAKGYAPTGPTKPAGPEGFVAVYDANVGAKLLTLAEDATSIERVVMGKDAVIVTTDFSKELQLWWWADLYETLGGPQGAATASAKQAPPQKKSKLGASYAQAPLASPSTTFTMSGSTTAYLVSLSPDGTRLAASSYQGDVMVWDVALGAVVAQWKTGRTRQEAMVFHGPTNWLVMGDTEAHVDIWRYEGPDAPTILTTISPPVEPDTPQSKNPFSSEVRALHCFPDQVTLLVGMDLDGSHAVFYELVPKP